MVNEELGNNILSELRQRDKRTALHYSLTGILLAEVLRNPKETGDQAKRGDEVFRSQANKGKKM